MALPLLVVLVVARSGVLAGEAGLFSDLHPRGFREISKLVLGISGSLLPQRHVLRQLPHSCDQFQAKV